MGIMDALIYQKEKEYKEYINNHKLNVERAWKQLRNNEECASIILNKVPPNFIDNLNELIIRHDNSKYSKDEFHAYRKEFYPVTPEERKNNKEAFEKAWRHHYYNNLHHWDWWYENNKEDSMPLIYVVEMICDWMAMSFQFNNKVSDWYYKQKNTGQIHLGKIQQEFVEKILSIIDK